MLCIDRVEDNALSLYDSYGQAIAQEPLPRGNEIYNFARPFIGHHYYVLPFFDLCLGVENEIFKEIMHLHYMTYMATPKHKNPNPRVIKSAILVDPSLDIITIHLVCLNQALK